MDDPMRKGLRKKFDVLYDGPGVFSAQQENMPAGR